MIMAYVEPETSFDATPTVSPEASSEAEESEVAVVEHEKSFDPDETQESDPDPVQSELMQLKLQLLQKQQEVDAQKREIEAQKLAIEALKLEKQILQGEHNIAICNLQQELRLGFVEKIKQIMTLYAAV